MPWKTAWQHTAVFFPGESHGRRSLVGYSPWGRKESTHWVTKRWKETQASKNILRRNRHVQKGSGRKEKRGWERGREGERKKRKEKKMNWGGGSDSGTPELTEVLGIPKQPRLPPERHPVTFRSGSETCRDRRAQPFHPSWTPEIERFSLVVQLQGLGYSPPLGATREWPPRPHVPGWSGQPRGRAQVQ